MCRKIIYLHVQIYMGCVVCDRDKYANFGNIKLQFIFYSSERDIQKIDYVFIRFNVSKGS